MIFYIITAFTVFLEMLLLEIMANAFFQAKPAYPRRPLRVMGFIAAYAVQVMNVLLFHQMFWVKLFFAFLIGFCYIHRFYQAKAADALSSITLYYSIMTGIDFIGILLLSIQEVSRNIRLYNGAILTVKLTEVGIGLVIREIWKRKSLVQELPNGIRRLMFFSGVLILIGAFISDFKMQKYSMTKVLVIMMIGITLLSNSLLLYLLLAAKSELEKSRLKDAAKRTRMQIELYKSKQELYKEQGKRMHDHRNQLLAISHMLEQGKADEALAYTRRLTGHMAKEMDKLHTGHPIADSILNMKRREALDKGIRIHFLCGGLSDSGLEEEEITIMLGNLLDNAIEAAAGCAQSKHIQVHISLEGKQLIIRVKNTCPHALRIEGGRIASTKNNPQAHGYGLTAIKDIVDKQDGSFAIRQEGGYVTATVILPIH